MHSLNLKYKLISQFASNPKMQRILHRCYFVECNDANKMPTVGIGFVGQTPVISYNPEFMIKNEVLTEKLMIHELSHMVLSHHKRAMSFSGIEFHIHNIAMDLAINSFLDLSYSEETPFCIPETGKFKDYPKGKSYEWYLDKMRQDPEMQKMMQSLEQFLKDMLEGKDPNDSDVKDELKKLFKQLIASHGTGDHDKVEIPDAFKEIFQEALKESLEKSGTGFQNVSKFFEEILEKKIDLKIYIRNKIRESYVHRNMERKWTHYNRRYPFARKGHKIKDWLDWIVLYVDQSGSVSDELLKEFFGIIKYINKSFGLIIVPFSDGIDGKGTLKYDRDQYRHYERSANGGTDFEKVVEFHALNYAQYDFCIITDLEANFPSEQIQKTGFKPVWICLREHFDRSGKNFQESEVYVVDKEED